MYPFPYLRSFWLPTALSPIPEEEETPQPTWIKAQHGPIDVQNYDIIGNQECNLIGPMGVLSNQNQSAPRTFDLERKIIESHSGRRQDSVEVLKQKYLNDDIQDIPRIIQGPLRYGRLHRSRSHLNLGSQDIRSQINKIRLRMGMIQCGDEDTKSVKPDYRCSKLKGLSPAPCMRTDSIEELLYGSPSADDYDPELAALFEDYVEVCDKPTRMTPVSAHPLRDRYVINRILMERALNTETRYAFLSGFLEGIYRSQDDETEALNRALLSKTTGPQEVPKDPCIDQTSHLDLIKSNQDITHKFLKEWEQTYRQDNADNNCFACHQQRVTQNSSFQKAMETCDVNKNELLTDNKNLKKRSLLPLGKTEFDLYVPDVTKPLLKKDPKGIKKPTIKKHSKTNKSELAVTSSIPAIQTTKIVQNCGRDPIFVSPEENRLADKGGDASSTTVLEEEKELGYRPHDRENITCQGDRNGHGKMIEKDISKFHSPCEFSIRDSTCLHVSDTIALSKSDHYHNKECREQRMKKRSFANVDTTDDVGIIELAKQKLENKHMSSAILEDFCRRRQESKQNEIEINRIKKESKEDTKPSAKAKSKPAVDSPALGDLDGWETDTKHLSDVDNLHVSSSELLHPVESLETFSPAVLTPIDTKDLKKVSEDVEGSKTGRKSTHDRETPTSAKLSDLEDRSCRNGSFETKAFKHRSPFANDFKKAANLVKLRLTKSCANVPANGSLNDSAFANVPLATCSNYYLEEKFKSKLQVKPIINLSERLAQRLRDIGRDNGKKDELLKQETSNQAIGPKSEKSIPTNGSPMLPAIEQEFARERGSSCSFTDKIALPDIGQSPSIGDGGLDELLTYDTKQARQGKYRVDSGIDTPTKTSAVDLPPISVKSYQRYCTTPIMNDVTDNKRTANIGWGLDETLPIGSVAVRAEVCTSPYKFDKADPNKLIVKAKSVPNHHTVCLSCGGISEKTVSTSPSTKGEKHLRRYTERIIHQHCSSPANDGKWKLNRTHSDHQRASPKVKVAKLLDDHHQHRPGKPRSAENLDSNPERKAAKVKNEEMTFNFLGQNIKLRFECELNVCADGERKEKANDSDKCKRLTDIAKPTHREKLKNPVSRETGIYVKKKKNVTEFSGFRDYLKSPNRESPYLEYCKRKAIMRCRKLQEIENELAKMSPDIDTDMEDETQRTSKKFPVLPIKRKKAQSINSSKKKEQQEPMHAAAKDCDDLIVKSDRLPLLTAKGSRPRHIETQSSTESIHEDGAVPVIDSESKGKCLEVFVQTCHMENKEQND